MPLENPWRVKTSGEMPHRTEHGPFIETRGATTQNTYMPFVDFAGYYITGTKMPFRAAFHQVLGEDPLGGAL